MPRPQEAIWFSQVWLLPRSINVTTTEAVLPMTFGLVATTPLLYFMSKTGSAAFRNGRAFTTGTTMLPP